MVPHSTAAGGRQISLSYVLDVNNVADSTCLMGGVGCNNIHCIEHMFDATQLTWLGMLGWGAIIFIALNTCLMLRNWHGFVYCHTCLVLCIDMARYCYVGAGFPPTCF